MRTHFVACVVIQVSDGRNLQICYFSHYFEMHVEDVVLSSEKRKRISVLSLIILNAKLSNTKLYLYEKYNNDKCH